MKKTVAICGTLLITAVLIISGSAIAGWYYVEYVDNYQDCTNPEDALYAPDGDHATIGRASGVPKLGYIILDFGINSGMLNNQYFTVYASSTVTETYNLTLHSYPPGYNSPIWTGLDDTTNVGLTAPSGLPVNYAWRYVEIWSEEGSTNDTDPIYGSEIDAVGYYQ